MFQYLNITRLVFGVFLALLVSSWLAMPVYPDEIATRIYLGRYFQDHKLFMGLYALCSPFGRPIPILFVPSAWIFSLLDSFISPSVARIFVASSLWFSIFFIMIYVLRKGSHLAALITCTALIGVAGSGLVLARPEIIQIIAFVTCLGVFWLQDSKDLSLRRHLAGVILVFATSITSCYSHLQGVLFLPLATFVAYRSLSLVWTHKLSITISVLFFSASVISTLQLHQLTCHGYPEIEKFWKMMMFNPEYFLHDFSHWLLSKFKGYVDNFIYKKNYTIGYLPGLVVQGWLRNLFFNILNFSIIFVVMTNFLAAIYIILLALVKLGNYFVLNKSYKRDFFNQKIWCFLLLATSPMVFLVFYDSAQNFYRSFFINMILAVSFSVWVSEKKPEPGRFLYKFYLLSVLVLMLLSCSINTIFFTERLGAGFEGPSVALSAFDSSLDRGIGELLKVCPIDMKIGRVVVDDLTYWTLRHYPYIYPITYIQLQAQLTGIGLGQAFMIVAPNVAITRCTSMDPLAIQSIGRVVPLCCSNFDIRKSVDK